MAGGTPEQQRSVRVTMLILLGVAALRLPFIGDAHVHIDETYYLLFADRWASGAIPYVGIWDRKPIGLFLLYRVALWFGSGAAGGIIAYQLLALAAVAATALMLARLAGERDGALGGARAALAAGLLYPAGLLALQGSGGQATVFTNLAATVAALLLVRALASARPFRLVAGAMAVLGLALQIKYTVAFEAAVLGLAGLAVLWRCGWRGVRLAAAALAMMALGLVPTLAAYGVFAAAGLGPAFLAANFATIAGKAGATHGGPPLALLLLLPIAALAVAGLRRHGRSPATIVLIAWMLVAVAAALLLGLPSEHYLQPVLPPLVLLAAAAAPRRLALGGAMATLIAAGTAATVIDVRNTGGFYLSYRIADAITPHLNGRCLYVVDSLPLLYALSGACSPTAYLFPTHLTRADEIASIGIDARAELARVLASRPSVIVIANPRQPYLDPVARRMIDARLADGYRLGDRFAFATGEYQLYYADR